MRFIWDGSSWGNLVSLDTSAPAEDDQTALKRRFRGPARPAALVVYGKDAQANLF